MKKINSCRELMCAHWKSQWSTKVSERKKQLLQNPLNVIISGTQTSWEKETTAKKAPIYYVYVHCENILENSVNIRLYTSRFTLWFLETYLSNLLAPGHLLRDRGRGRDHHKVLGRGQGETIQRQGIAHQFSAISRTMDGGIPQFFLLFRVRCLGRDQVRYFFLIPRLFGSRYEDLTAIFHSKLNLFPT